MCCARCTRFSLHPQSNGAVIFWRIVPRNLFGGANKNDRPEEAMTTSLPHKGAVMCLAHTPRGTYGALGGPLVFSGATDHTIKVRNVCRGWSGFHLRRILAHVCRPNSRLTLKIRGEPHKAK